MSSNRTLIVAAAVLFIGSTAILIAASRCRCTLPRWAGPLDVGTAVAIVALAGALWIKGHHGVDHESHRITHGVVTTLVPVVLLVLWAFRDPLEWNILLPGLAWRSLIVLHAMPVTIVLWKRSDQLT